MSRTLIAVLSVLAVCALCISMAGCGGGVSLGAADGYVFMDPAGGLHVLATNTPEAGWTPVTDIVGTIVDSAGVSHTIQTNGQGFYFVDGLATGDAVVSISIGGHVIPPFHITIVDGEVTAGGGHTEGTTG